jgi:hypothetical protein
LLLFVVFPVELCLVFFCMCRTKQHGGGDAQGVIRGMLFSEPDAIPMFAYGIEVLLQSLFLSLDLDCGLYVVIRSGCNALFYRFNAKHLVQSLAWCFLLGRPPCCRQVSN